MKAKRILAVVLILLIGVAAGLAISTQTDYFDKLDIPFVKAEASALEFSNNRTAPTIEPNEAYKNLQNTYAQIARNIKPCVVNISTTRVVKYSNPFFDSPFEDFFYDDEFFNRFFGEPFHQRRRGQQQQPERKMEQHSLGSGFVIHSDGYILTNNHVVAQADEIIVKLQTEDGDEKEYKADLVGTDPETDLAVIKIDPGSKSLLAAPLGDSEETVVGDLVVAVGNPFGLEYTVTTGIISAKSRSLPGHSPYYDFLQTDAAINPGNSGGPLINIRGEVIGINTAIYSRSGGYQGIGFAIPINLAKEIVEDLIEKGKSTRGYLGVYIQELDEKLAKAYGLDSTQGVLIADVQEGLPADKAGLKQGDVIVEVDGKKIEKTSQLQRVVGAIDPGTTVEVVVIREGKRKTFDVKLGERPTEVAEAPGASPKDTYGLGLRLRDLTPGLARKLESESEHGAVVVDVEPGSPAAEAGLQEGDIILKADRKEVNSASDFYNIVKKVDKGDGLLVLVEHKGMNRFVVIEIPED